MNKKSIIGNKTLESLGKILAQNTIQKYATNDVFLLCKKTEIELRYEKWHPVTLGEFDKKTNTICINLTTKIDPKQIIAHELGHYFIHQMELKFSRIEEEKIIENFAKILLSY